MNVLKILCLFTAFAIFSKTPLAQTSKDTKAVTFRGVPCGYDCDKTTFDRPGKCPHCQMDLVDVRTITFKTIAPEALCDYVKAHPNVVLLDVRTKEEFEGKADPDFGTLKNAVNVPVQELEARLSSLSAWENKDIIVYC